MRFFVNGRYDIRPLASEDKAHIPLPYDYKSLATVNTFAVTNEHFFTKYFTATDWGSGLDFYFLSLSLDVWFSNNSFLDWDHVVNIKVTEEEFVGMGWVIINYVISETLHPSQYQTYRVLTGIWIGNLLLTLKGDMDKINAANRMGLYLENRTGNTIYAYDISAWLKGVVI